MELGPSLVDTVAGGCLHRDELLGLVSRLTATFVPWEGGLGRHKFVGMSWEYLRLTGRDTQLASGTVETAVTGLCTVENLVGGDQG